MENYNLINVENGIAEISVSDMTNSNIENIMDELNVNVIIF